MTALILLCGGFHFPRDPDGGPAYVSELFFSALLKLVTDWSLVLCERSLRKEDGILIFCCICTVDICNGWKINVSDVPVNVNKIKPVLKGTQHTLSGSVRVDRLSFTRQVIIKSHL